MSNEILTHLIAGNAHADAGATQRTNINPATGETVSIAPMDAVQAATQLCVNGHLLSQKLPKEAQGGNTWPRAIYVCCGTRAARAAAIWL